MKRFIDPSARPAMTGRYREGQTRDAHTRLPNPELWREQELTPEQKAALESWSKRPLPPLPQETPGCGYCTARPLRLDECVHCGAEVVFIPEGE